MAVDFGPLQEACRDTFGEEVTFTPQGGSPATVTGIFNAKSLEISAEGLPVYSTRPNLGVKTADLAGAPAVGDSVTVRAVSYKVAEIDDDGEGMTILYLHKAT